MARTKRHPMDYKTSRTAYPTRSELDEAERLMAEYNARPACPRCGVDHTMSKGKCVLCQYVDPNPDPRDNTRLVLCGGELIEVGGAMSADDEIPF